MTSLFIYAVMLSLVSTILVIFLTSKYNLFIDKSDTEKPQSFHTNSTPRAGGLGILVGSLLLLFSGFGVKLVIPILFAFASGIFEDFHNSLSPKLRLFLQFIAAVSAVWLTNSVVTYLGLGITMPYWMGALFSIFAIVGMMNAINIIDGFNGLASGVVLLILTSFTIVAYSHHNSDILSIVSILIGATLGFFILNFPKGKIFLGDGGAYMLGFVVAVLGIFLASRYENVSPWYILAIFIYPVWEVLFSIVRKLSIGLSPMQPDSYHMHMLIYRQITKNNPLTALFILIILLPSTIVSTLYAHSSLANIMIVFSFVVGYLVLYMFLYKKDISNL
jgi:UDP-N-acetylmuramyl pentapeptide phosphotransferase/UDP-N-acetylglucosamine-1-phosphate transferase